MADLYWAGSGPINLGAATQLCTLALQTPSAPRIKIAKICVSFNGATGTNTPVNCQLAKVTNTPSGTAIATNYGPNPLEWAAPASLTVAKTASTATPGAWTTAPAEGAITWEIEIPPTSGLPEWFPLGYEVIPTVSSWIGVFLTAPQAVTAYTSLLYLE